MNRDEVRADEGKGVNRTALLEVMRLESVEMVYCGEERSVS